MEKELKTLNTICKIARIIASILFVAYVVGVIGCALCGLVTLLTKDALLANLQSLGIEGLSDANFSMYQIYGAIIVGLIACGFGCVIAKKNVNFYKFALRVGQPLDLQLADRMKKLGIYNIVLPLISQIVCSLIWNMANAISSATTKFEIDASISIDYGIALIVISLIIRYAVNKVNEANNQQVFDEELSK